MNIYKKGRKSKQTNKCLNNTRNKARKKRHFGGGGRELLDSTEMQQGANNLKLKYQFQFHFMLKAV